MPAGSSGFCSKSELVHRVQILVYIILDNIAAGLPSSSASQSSTYDSRTGAEKAIDGSSSQRLDAHQACSNTNNLLTQFPWWKLDLGNQVDQFP